MRNGHAEYLPFGTVAPLYDMMPQHFEFLINNCGVLASALRRRGDFIRGLGFEDTVFGESVVCSDGTTANELLHDISYQMSFYNNFALWVGYNPFAQVSDVQLLRLSKVRIGAPDADGAVCNYIETNRYDKYTYSKSRPNIYERVYPKFTTDTSKVTRQIIDAGGIELSGEQARLCFGGSILYARDNDQTHDFYVFPDWVSAIRSVESDILTAQSMKNKVETGFSANTVITQFIPSPSKEQKAEDEQLFNGAMGVEGGGIMMLYANNQESAPRIDTIDAPDIADGFEVSSRISREQIERAIGVPRELLPYTDNNTFFDNPDRVRQVWELYQETYLLPIQKFISKRFKDVFSNSRTPSASGNYNIKPKKYESPTI